MAGAAASCVLDRARQVYPFLRRPLAASVATRRCMVDGSDQQVATPYAAANLGTSSLGGQFDR